MEINNAWKQKTFIIGGLIGLISGVFAAYIFVQQNERHQEPPAITAKDGVKLGLGLLTLLRLIAELANRD